LKKELDDSQAELTAKKEDVANALQQLDSVQQQLQEELSKNERSDASVAQTLQVLFLLC
jgi:predicted nuclease with TOPRIM domain